MRTYKWMAVIVLLLSMTSCGTYYRMVSQVNSDGSMHREVYAYGDSAFLAGDRTPKKMEILVMINRAL